MIFKLLSSLGNEKDVRSITFYIFNFVVKMTYNNRHKVFLQSLIQEGTLHDDKAKDLVITLFNDDKVSLIVNQINEQLRILDMTIKKGHCEVTGESYWVLCSTTLNEITRLQDEFSRGQLALLRNIFSEIITSSTGYVESTMCLNFSSSLDVKLSKAEAEEFLNDIVEKRWLSYKDGHYYMGVRSITELMPYFRETYGSTLNTCCLCKKIIFYGERCGHCESTMHLFCLKKFAMISKRMKCPNCNHPLQIDTLSE